MDTNTQLPALSRVIEAKGLKAVADACSVKYQAVRKWEQKGMPRTEWTGESHHADAIVALAPDLVSKAELLQARPVKQPRKRLAGGRRKKR